jgi:diaminopimelate epimerase
MKAEPEMNGSMRHSLTNPSVIKMNGLGNEIAVLDARGDDRWRVDGTLARAIARSLAFDQLMVIGNPRTPGTEAFVDIYNRDGSRAGACGNGSRCVAFILFRDRAADALLLETDAGPLECRRIDTWTYSVDMGRPRFDWGDIPLSRDVGDTRAVLLATSAGERTASLVSMGNPHAVFFVGALDEIDLASFGPLMEHHAIFPERANISLAQVTAPDHIRLRVWERGAGLTRACGSAACAALVAAARGGLARRSAIVSLPGGDLNITWRDSDDHVIMTGPVAYEFEAPIDPALFASASV